MAFCSNCGNALQAGAPFCSSCGTAQASPPTQMAGPPVQQPYAPMPPQQQYYPPPQPQYPQGYPPSGGYAPPQQGYYPVAQPPALHRAPGGNKWIVVVAIIAALGFWLYKSGFFEDPKDVVNRFLDGVQAMDTEAVMATVHPSQRAQARPLLELGFARMKATGAQFQITDRNITVLKKEGDKCLTQVKYTLVIPSLNQKQPQDEQVPLIKEDGHWYIAEVSGF